MFRFMLVKIGNRVKFFSAEIANEVFRISLMCHTSSYCDNCAADDATNLLPAETECHAGAVGRRFDLRLTGQRFYEIDAASTRTVEEGGMRRIRHKLRRETSATITNCESNLAIGNAAFELDLARLAFATSMTDRIRHAFGQCKQNIMLQIVRHVRIFQLSACPIMDLLQFFQCPRYEKMLQCLIRVSNCA